MLVILEKTKFSNIESDEKENLAYIIYPFVIPTAQKGRIPLIHENFLPVKEN